MREDILQRCVLFRNMQGKRLKEALEFFHAQERVFRRGEYLHHPGEPLHTFGLVLSGNIQVSMDDFDGNHMIMASVTPGITFGESLCYLGQEAQVSIISVEESRGLQMDTESLKKENADLELSRRFTAMLAQRSLQLNDRIQILSKPTIREKVITLLSQYAVRSDDTVIRLPFTREAMATYLGVNQSALSRELGNMQKEGILRYKNNVFEIL